jgi:zinc transport system permease protein
MPSFLSYEFMQNAILTGIMASIVCGVIGPFIVARRMVFISGGLSHTALGGLGMAYWMGINPIYGASLFVLLAALIIGWWEEKITKYDMFIGILWAFGVAVGIIFIHLTPGYVPDLMTFLFGNILTVSRTDLHITLLLTLIVILPIFIFFKGLTFITFDEEYARTRNLPVKALNMMLIAIVALSIVTLIQVVGIILVIALMTIPVAIAGELSGSFKGVMVISTLFGIFFCLFGLFFSYFLELPSGAAIIMTGVIALVLIKSLKQFTVRCRHLKNRGAPHIQ